MGGALLVPLFWLVGAKHALCFSPRAIVVFLYLFFFCYTIVSSGGGVLSVWKCAVNKTANLELHGLCSSGDCFLSPPGFVQ